MTLPDADLALHVGAGVAWDGARLAASSGVEPARQRHARTGYAAQAWIPREDWQAVDTDALLPATASRTRATTIGVCAVGRELVERLRAERHAAQSPGSLAGYAPALCRELARDWLVVQPPPSLSLGRNRDALPTVTRDPVTGELVGLHIDTFHDRYDATRSGAGNRVSVNVGTAPRYLLFAPYSLRTLHRLAGAPTGRFDLAASFFAANADRPILRLRVDPGEAYVAATESLVHDGRASGGDAEDLHVTGRGLFDPRC